MPRGRAFHRLRPFPGPAANLRPGRNLIHRPTWLRRGRAAFRSSNSSLGSPSWSPDRPFPPLPPRPPRRGRTAPPGGGDPWTSCLELVALALRAPRRHSLAGQGGRSVSESRRSSDSAASRSSSFKEPGRGTTTSCGNPGGTGPARGRSPVRARRQRRSPSTASHPGDPDPGPRDRAANPGSVSPRLPAGPLRRAGARSGGGPDRKPPPLGSASEGGRRGAGGCVRPGTARRGSPFTPIARSRSATRPTRSGGSPAAAPGGPDLSPSDSRTTGAGPGGQRSRSAGSRAAAIRQLEEVGRACGRSSRIEAIPAPHRGPSDPLRARLADLGQAMGAARLAVAPLRTEAGPIGLLIVEDRSAAKPADWSALPGSRSSARRPCRTRCAQRTAPPRPEPVSSGRSASRGPGSALPVVCSSSEGSRREERIWRSSRRRSTSRDEDRSSPRSARSLRSGGGDRSGGSDPARRERPVRSAGHRAAESDPGLRNDPRPGRAADRGTADR